MIGRPASVGERAEPVFIHSLFRAGSTYLFHVFRRSSAGYWCYQEPLHEIALFAQKDRDVLLTERGEKSELLRHPRLGDPYFLELYEVAEQCLGTLKKRDVYDAYFAPADGDFGADYWRSLIAAARGRPVIQECRTSSRIGAIKRAVGGTHLYLWRNPWDQWWSYKVAEYFEAANQLFVNAPEHPEVIARLRREIGFGAHGADDVAAQFDWFVSHPLPPEHSYLVFYVLWCLGLREALAHADLVVSIDRLSNSASFRRELSGELAALGVTGVDFSDCATPQTRYAGEERAFFERIEEKAHGLLLLSGVGQRELDRLAALRRAHEPASWPPDAPATEQAPILRDAARARMLVLRAEGREVHLRAAWTHEVSVQQQLAAAAETRLFEQERRALGAELRVTELDGQLTAAQAGLQDLRQRALVAEAEADAWERSATQHERHAAELAERVAGLTQRVVELEQQALEQERRAIEQEQRAVEQERRAAGSTHQWWLQASALEEERDALLRSWSWRVTAPMRSLGGLAIHGTTGARRAANHAVHRGIKVMRGPLGAMMRTVMRRPGLSFRINQHLMRYPALHQQLLGVARAEGLLPEMPAPIFPRPTPIGETGGLEALDEYARRIYFDLKAAMETRHKDNG